MRRTTVAVVYLLLGALSTASHGSMCDYARLTPAQIDTLKEERLQMYRYEGERREQAVKRALLNQALYFNANQSNYDVRYYGIHLSLNFDSSRIKGYVDYRLRAVMDGLSSVDLDLHDQLMVDSVKVGTNRLTFSHTSGTLAITLPRSFSSGAEFAMQVYYHGTPFYGWGYVDGGMAFDVKGNYPICFTSCEPYSSRNWWPCKDTPEDKADSLDLYVECPVDYDVASNGVIVSNQSIGGGRRLYHWKHMYPITTYLIALSCANFDVLTTTWNYGGYSMPVYRFSIPNDHDGQRAFDSLTVPVLNIYSDAYGLYPFVSEKLANVSSGSWGTMEHQTCSFHEAFGFYDWVYPVIHENAHQWWGDMITCKTYHDIWLNEGLATYSEAIFYEKRQGMDAYHNYMSTLEWPGEGTIYVEDPETEVIFDGSLSYNKAAWVMHMLRGVLGDSAFFKALKDWAGSEFRYGSATTTDFTNVLSRSVGADMGWFVNEWIYGNGHPEYTVSRLCEPDSVNGGYSLSYFVRQTHTYSTCFTYFKMPIRHRFVTTGGYVDTVLWNEGKGESYLLHFADSVTGIIVDPEHWISRDVAWEAFRMHAHPCTLPDAHVGQFYSQRLGEVGGTAPYRWTYWGGDLPYGMSFQGDTVGLISGIPTWRATFYFAVRVVDSKPIPDTVYESFEITTLPYPGCGDANNSGEVNISDVVFLISYVFAGGNAPAPMVAGDADCNGSVNISDAVYLIAYIFSGGLMPCAGCE